MKNPILPAMNYPLLSKELLDKILDVLDKNKINPIKIMHLFDEALVIMENSGNAYHNENHIRYVLTKIFELDKNIKLKNEEYLALVIAAFYHDIIYDPQKHDNEIKSIEYMYDALKFVMRLHNEQVSDNFNAILDLAKTLIEATTYKKPWYQLTELQQFFCDCDLAIFSDSEDANQRFEDAVFDEYQFVDLGDYIKGRETVLHKLYELGYLKHMPWFNISYFKHKQYRIGLYIGSFNPWHIGHEYVLNKAEELFDKVIIGIGANNKEKLSFGNLPHKNQKINFEVLTKYLDTLNYKVTLIRGLRNATDLIYEQNYAETINDIKPRQNFVYINTKQEYAHISSSMIREMYKIYDGDMSYIQKYLSKK